MAYFIDMPPRIGRSQGATLFWGLISVCFAAGACYYFWQNSENERQADKWQDQALQLQDRIDSLQAEKTHLQAGMADQESQLKSREDLVQEKESELAAEEMQIEGMGRQNATIAAQNQAQVAMVKKFNDAIRAVSGTMTPDVVERFGRPVLRVPNAQLFAPGDSTLTPDGKTMLGQLAQAIQGQMDTFELRVVCYTDTDAEAAPGAAKKDADDPHAGAWALTSARASVLARFFRDSTQVPFLNVLVSGRGDAEPIAANAGDNRVRNQRVEITVAPLPVPFHAPDAAGDGASTPTRRRAKVMATPPVALPVALPVTPVNPSTEPNTTPGPPKLRQSNKPPEQTPAQ